MNTPAARASADFIGRQETLEDDLHTIYDHLGLEWVELASVNIDPGRPDYHDVYTPVTRRPDRRAVRRRPARRTATSSDPAHSRPGRLRTQGERVPPGVTRRTKTHVH